MDCNGMQEGNDFVVFELVQNNNSADEIIDNYYLKRYTGRADETAQQEAKQWIPVMKVKYEREDLVYGDGRMETGSYESEANVFPREIVVKNGHFVGFLLRFSDVSSYGMSVTESKKIGIVFIDGSTAGTTAQHYSHCSTEKDETKHITYYCRKI